MFSEVSPQLYDGPGDDDYGAYDLQALQKFHMKLLW